MTLSAVLALSLATFAFHQAQAAPNASPAQLQAQLDRLNQQADQLVEEYDQSTVALEHLKAAMGGLQSETDQARQRVDGLQHVVAMRAVDAYMHGASTDLVALLQASNPDQVLYRAQALDMLAQENGDALADLNTATSAYAQRKAELTTAVGQAQALVDQLGAKKRQVEAKAAETERLLRRLQAAHVSPAGQGGSTTGGGSSSTPPPVPPGVSGGAKAAVAFALAQVGKPYHWGGTGPGSYDCSGLTMVAWSHGGVSLPHSSSAQYGVGVHVTRSELRPGDLVFFYSPISHVAMYIGNGKVVDATHTGSYVLVQTLRTDAVGYTRPEG